MLVRRLVPLPAAGCTLAAPSPRFRHAATFARRHGSSSGLLEELDREVDRTLERATRATVTWTPLATGFVSPAVTAAVVSALSTSADTGVIPWGGYPQAERARLLLGPRDMLDVWAGEPAGAPWPPPPPPIQILHVRGNFLFDPGRHADFLGAVLGTGIERSMVGDVVGVGDRGAHVFVSSSIVPHLEASLTQVRSVPVTLSLTDLADLALPPPRIREVSSVEASLRLDSILSAGLRLSRSKAADLVRQGSVRVNWRPVAKPSVELSAGDIISCSGKGRLVLRDAQPTAKGRWRVTMTQTV
ncbi:CPL15 [Auxenochlorella protothecoides x Auxenochlorella symbiontica]